MQVLDTLPKRQRGRPAKYDWASLLDGQTRRLNRRDDFPDVMDAQTFRMMVYTAASRADTNVHAYVENNDALVIQQYEKG